MSTVKTYSLFTEFDIHLFRQGKHYSLYEKLGSHTVEVDEFAAFHVCESSTGQQEHGCSEQVGGADPAYLDGISRKGFPYLLLPVLLQTGFD